MEKIDYDIRENLLENNLILYVRDEKINKALAELKRKDKSNLAIIEDTIKILEEGLPIDKNMGERSLAELSEKLAAPVKPVDDSLWKINNPAIVDSINTQMSQMVLPSNEDIVKSINESIGKSNMFMGGMK